VYLPEKVAKKVIELFKEQDEPFDNLGYFHFLLKSWISIIPTFLYQYTIFSLIRMLIYKKDFASSDGPGSPAMIIKVE
jgi:hypothetical protein